MSFHKFTLISGKTADGAFKGLTPTGHWNLAAAIRRARASKLVGEFTVTHYVSDTSGHGRGGVDDEWIVDADDNAFRWVILHNYHPSPKTKESDMRTEFYECKSHHTAKKRAPWAAVISKVDGGYVAYESVADWQTAKMQK